jgi:hypothetical protein
MLATGEVGEQVRVRMRSNPRLGRVLLGLVEDAD